MMAMGCFHGRGWGELGWAGMAGLVVTGERFCRRLHSAPRSWTRAWEHWAGFESGTLFGQ